MKKDLLRILLKIYLLSGLTYNLHYNTAEAKENLNLKQLSTEKGLTMEERMSKIEAENHQHKTEISLLKTKLDNGINSISKLEDENSVLKIKIYEDSKEIQELNDRVARLESKEFINSSKMNDKSDVFDRKERPARLLPYHYLFYNKNNTQNQNAASMFLGPPTNCSELGMLGYTLNGYYLVKSSDKSNRNKIVTVYCAFRQAQGLMNKQVLQTRIGNVEVRSRPIYFHVYITENVNAGFLPFRFRDINVGDAMGEYEFTAPVAGIYQFQFHGKVLNSSSDFKLAVTTNNQVLNNFYLDCSNCSIQTLHFSRIYRLKEKDQIRLFKSGSNSTIVAGKINAYTTPSSFAGWLVEEN